MKSINKHKIAKLVEDNYGSIYKSTGGGRVKMAGQTVKKFMKALLGNRVLDLYLKYGGIKTLSTATMVPMALIIGKDYVEALIKGQIGGGDIIPKKIPILDHPLVGSYLKLIGLSSINITMNTLVPLGIVMIIHDLYNTPTQSGGSSSIFGRSIPSNIFNSVGLTMSGNSPSMLTSTNYEIHDVPVSNLQCTGGLCGPNTFSSQFKDSGIIKTPILGIPGIPGVDIPDSSVNLEWSATLDPRGTSNISPSMAGGGNNLYEYIYHPSNKRKYKINTKMGQNILNKYLNKTSYNK